MTQLYKQISTVVLFCTLLFFYQTAYGQTIADTLQLEEIEVVATRIHQPLIYQPTNVEVTDSSRLSLLKGQSIGEVMATESSLFIKEYGPGGMATASQRGLSSEQIQVLWEGVPINSPTLGQTDLSLLPANIFSEIQLSSGTPSTAFGGGSLSGALYLRSDWKDGKYFSARQRVGSYGQWQSSLEGRYSTQELQVSVHSLYDYSENDFEYYNRAYNRTEKREHNRSEGVNVMASVGKELNSGHWKSVFWVADKDNQIPGSILKIDSKSRQEDQALRWLNTYERQLGNAEFSFKNYLSRAELNYFDPDTDTRSFSTNKRWMVSSDLKYPVAEQLSLKGEISGALTGVASNNYVTDKSRSQFSMLANPEVMLLDHRLRLYPALRMDAYNDFGTVVSPSLGGNYELLLDKLFLRGQLSRDFNPPTFNALYWGQGGNPNLKAERSNTGEAGITITPRKFLGVSSIRLTSYYSKISNGIRWYPGDDGIYTPSNVEELTTKGIEAEIDNSYLISPGWQLNIQQSGILNRTEIMAPRFPGDEAVGSQLRYTPQWKYNASLSLQKDIFKGLIQYRWVGRRYTTDTEDLRDSLDPYQVLDVSVQTQKQLQALEFTLQAGIKNLLDADYEIIQWYAMPQRNFSLSLTVTYHL